MLNYKIVTITHKTTKVTKLKDYLLTDGDVSDFPALKLQLLKQKFDILELLYLNTCNRVTFFFTKEDTINDVFLKQLFLFINPHFTEEILEAHLQKVLVYEGEEAIKHFFGVAASLDSLVIGEREIAGQIKQAYKNCKEHDLCADSIRLAYEQAIVFGKKIQSETKIGDKPISVVSLAFRQLMNSNISQNPNILMVGAGQTNFLLSNFLLDKQFENIDIFNRTFENAQKLAARFSNGNAFNLEALTNHNSNNYDVIIACTSSQKPLINNAIFNKIAKKNKPIVVVDLAVPQNIDIEVLEQQNIEYIGIESLEKQAADNLKCRKAELQIALQILETFVDEFKNTFLERQFEKALHNLPKAVTDIKQRTQFVFEKEIQNLDENAKETLQNILNYMEKKYIALPFKTAKKIVLNKKYHK